MRKLLRSMARAELERQGCSNVNKNLGSSWREITGAYPGFKGQKKQRKGSKQPILCYRIVN